jgi:transposase
MDFYLDTLLNLPNVVADSYSSTLDAVVIKLQLINAGINCPNCNKYICHVHQTRPTLVRDLSIFGRVVYLKVPRHQFYCSDCKISPTESLSWVNKRQRQTNRYQEYIYERVSVAGDPQRKELTVKQVSENEKMSEDAVQDIFHKVANSKKKDWGLPERLSLTVVDRFHVQKLVNKALNKLRLILKLKGLKNRYLLMSNQANLASEEREELELILKSSPSLRIGHELKEELITIYNSDITASGGMRKINKWLISARVMFGSAADTLESHLEEICNYFTNKTTSGVTEGINTKIKLIVRQSYGFKNFDLMKEKLLACLFK